MSMSVENLQDLDQRVHRLRQLLNGDAPTLIPESQPVEMFEGHTPVHAAPGPLLDELKTPASFVGVHDVSHASQ